MATSGPPPARLPRAVPTSHVAAWYREALRLFRRAPLTFALLAVATLGCELALSGIPLAGGPLSVLLTPLVACGLLYASLAADRGEAVRLRFALLAFGARAEAVAAVLAASIVAFAVQATLAWYLERVNLLDPASADGLTSAGAAAVFAAGLAASLPLTFVPFAALFGGESAGGAFRGSLAAAARNAGPLALYGACALALALVAAATYGVALVVVVPLWAASSYAAWKDVFGVDATGASDERPA